MDAEKQWFLWLSNDLQNLGFPHHSSVQILWLLVLSIVRLDMAGQYQRHSPRTSFTQLNPISLTNFGWMNSFFFMKPYCWSIYPSFNPTFFVLRLKKTTLCLVLTSSPKRTHGPTPSPRDRDPSHHEVHETHGVLLQTQLLGALLHRIFLSQLLTLGKAFVFRSTSVLVGSGLIKRTPYCSRVGGFKPSEKY